MFAAGDGELCQVAALIGEIGVFAAADMKSKPEFIGEIANAVEAGAAQVGREWLAEIVATA